MWLLYFSTFTSLWCYKWNILWKYQGKIKIPLDHSVSIYFEVIRHAENVFEVNSEVVYVKMNVNIDLGIPQLNLVFLWWQAWLSEIYEYASPDVIIMLLGNKVCLVWNKNYCYDSLPFASWMLVFGPPFSTFVQSKDLT